MLYKDVIAHPDRYSFSISQLGIPTIPSPVRRHAFVSEDTRIVFSSNITVLKKLGEKGVAHTSFEKAGPREKIFHDPAWTRAAIVTCGGLCPGLNNVIKNLVSTLWYQYGVKHIYGIKYGYEGLNPACGHEPLMLDPEFVDNIHEDGGTILGSSRGNQDIGVMVDTLVRMNINILFCVGGDGTLKGAHQISEEIKRRGCKISIIGVPKTIDNDLLFTERSFGFETAVYQTYSILTSAHNEAKGAYKGIGLVKLMGRDSGFIAMAAALANSVVNFCLIPELDFTLQGKHGLLKALERRFEVSNHAVIVVAEGAGQDLFASSEITKDISGNIMHHDIGIMLRDSISAYFKNQGKNVSVKYFDPSYLIRSVPARGSDAIFCNIIAEHAVHAGMAGKTDMTVGFWNHSFTHVPIPLMVIQRNKVDLNGIEWQSVLDSNGQTTYFDY